MSISTHLSRAIITADTTYPRTSISHSMPARDQPSIECISVAQAGTLRWYRQLQASTKTAPVPVRDPVFGYWNLSGTGLALRWYQLAAPEYQNGDAAIETLPNSDGRFIDISPVYKAHVR